MRGQQGQEGKGGQGQEGKGEGKGGSTSTIASAAADWHEGDALQQQ